MLNVKIPVGFEPINFLVGFASAFNDSKMRAALLGIQDSFRQAELLPLEPLGLLACLTAEEEAAEFLYYALVEKKYEVPQHSKLRDHREKVKFTFVAMVLQNYFFPDDFPFPENAVWIERDGTVPKTTRRWTMGDLKFSQEDPLELIKAVGEGEEGHDAAVKEAVDSLVAEMTPKGYTAQSYIAKLANRRNLCLYGDPKSKLRLKDPSEVELFKINCCTLIVLGFLVFNSNVPTASMKKLIGEILSRFPSRE